MARTQRVRDYTYSGRQLADFYCVVDDDGLPILAPCVFLGYRAKNKNSTNTSQTYANVLAKFFSVLERNDTDYRTLRDQEMNSYLYGYLKEECGLVNTTITLHVACLSEFYDACASHGLMEQKKFSFDYAAGEDMHKIDKSRLQLLSLYLSEEDFDKKILANVADPDSDPFIVERDEIALCLGYQAGLRTHELVSHGNLSIEKLQDLIPEYGGSQVDSVYLFVRGKGVDKKTGLPKGRDVPLWPDLVHRIHRFMYNPVYRKILKKHLICSKNGVPIKSKSYGSTLFATAKSSYLKKNAVDEKERACWESRGFHVLRKCFATNAVTFCRDTGLDPVNWVTQWMGHADYRTTRDIYICFEALLKNRLGVQAQLGLNNSYFAKTYEEKYGKAQ